MLQLSSFFSMVRTSLHGVGTDTQFIPSEQPQPATLLHSPQGKFLQFTHFPFQQPHPLGQSDPREHSPPQSGTLLQFTLSVHSQPKRVLHSVPQVLLAHGSHCFVTGLQPQPGPQSVPFSQLPLHGFTVHCFVIGWQ